MGSIIFLAKLYIFVLGLCSVCTMYRYRQLDLASRIFTWYIFAAFCAESIAFFAAKYFHNNMPLYAIYSLAEFGIISAYFNYSIDVFRKRNIGLWIGAAGIIIGILNIIYLQPIYTLNSYFLFFEGIFIISMSLFSFFRMLLMQDELKLHTYHHFWVAVILSFFWSITFLNWGLYDYFAQVLPSFNWIINHSILVVDMITYLSFAIVFLYYPKMKQNYV